MNVLDMVGQVLVACDEVDKLRQVVAERDAEIKRLQAQVALFRARDEEHAATAEMYYSLYCAEVKRKRVNV